MASSTVWHRVNKRTHEVTARLVVRTSLDGSIPDVEHGTARDRVFFADGTQENMHSPHWMWFKHQSQALEYARRLRNGECAWWFGWEDIIDPDKGPRPAYRTGMLKRRQERIRRWKENRLND